MANKMLEMDLTPEDEKLLRESLEDWKESVYSNLLEEVEQLKEKTIQELEEANQEYLSEIKKEYTGKMVKALNEMREDIRSEVFAEMVTSNPELQVLEKIKALVAPTLNEEFSGNVYSEQITNLVEENAALKREMELNEGARTLAGLIKDYDRKTQKLILSVIKEGNAEEITEQFYQIAESLELFEEKGEDGEELPDEDKETDAKKDATDAKYHSFTDWKNDESKGPPEEDDFESKADYKKALAQWETDDDKDKVEEAYSEWIASEPTRRDFDLKEDFEYAHALWEEDEPEFGEDDEIDAVKKKEKKDDEEDDDEEDDDNAEEDDEKETKGKKTEKFNFDKKKAASKKVEDDEDLEDDEDEEELEDDEDKEVKKDDKKEKADKKSKAGDIEESVKLGRKGLKSYITESTVGREKAPKKATNTNKSAILKLANQ